MASLDMVSAAIQAAVYDALSTAGYTVPFFRLPWVPRLALPSRRFLARTNRRLRFTLWMPHRRISQVAALSGATSPCKPRPSRPLSARFSTNTNSRSALPVLVESFGTMFRFLFNGTPRPIRPSGTTILPLPFRLVSMFTRSLVPPLTDLAYQTQSGETVNTLAAAVASGINTLNYDLVSAYASGATVTVSESPYLYCNIGWTGVMVREVRRMQTPFQITVWAANPDDRTAIANIIDSYVAIDTIPFLEAADHAAIRIRLTRPSWNDDSQASYSLYCAHFVYECEYPTLQTIVSTTIESVGNTLDIQTPSGVQQDPVRYIHD